MAQKKAFYNYQYIKCSNEAKNFVNTWFKKNNILIDPESIYIIWFAFSKNGYRCMVTSKEYQNNFFEINKNIFNDELICHIFNQVECIVHPSQAEPIVIKNSNNLFD